MEIDIHKLGLPKTIGEITGKLTKKRAAELALPADIPVLDCGEDFLAALIGSNTLQAGKSCDRAGTSEGINFCSPTAVKSNRLRCLPHPKQNYWNISSLLSGTGLVFEWFRRISAYKEENYDFLFQSISESLPYQASPYFYPSTQKGDSWIFGASHFIGLQPQHQREDLARAVVQSIGYIISRSLKQFSEEGIKIEAMTLSGGQSGSDIWNQIKSDMTNCRLDLPHCRDTELLGCAAISLAALGYYQNYFEAAEKLLRLEKQYHPDPKKYNLYREIFYQIRKQQPDFKQGFLNK